MSYLRGIDSRWPVVPFAEVVASSEYGLSLASDRNGNTPILKMNSLSEGKVSLADLDRVNCSAEDFTRYAIRKGDILFNRTNSVVLVGKTAVVREDADVVFASYLVRFRVKQSVDPRFVSYWFNSERAKSRMKELATPGVSQSNINPARLQHDLYLPLPPLHDQRRIADILDTWDEALEKLDAVIVARDRRKKMLMQQLLTGRLRLPGHTYRWMSRPLRDLIEPVTRPVTKPTVAFLAAGIRSHGKGVFLKPSFEPKEIDLNELFEIKTDDLIVNITFAWEGATAIVTPEANGALVSHRFPTFRIRETEAALSFMRHYILTKRFVFNCGLASPGGAGRNRVLSKTAFLKIELFVPSVAEQREIGAILDTSDSELRLLRNQRATINNQKRGLMQRMLTGAIRVSAS